MRLDVPRVMQRRGSADCAPASIAMLLQYYGYDASVDSINKELNRDGNSGMFIGPVGAYLLNKLLDVTIVGRIPYVFLAQKFVENGINCRDYVEELKRAGHSNISVSFVNRLNELIEFIMIGGNYEYKIPSINEIACELYCKRPVLFVSPSNYFDKQSWDGFMHVSVITGINGSSFYINDPDDVCCKVRHPIGKFSFGYKNLYNSLGSCFIIKVRDDIFRFR